MEVKTANNFFRRMLIVLFFIVIFAPSVRMISGDRPLIAYTEKRTLATFPSFPDNQAQLRTFFTGIDEYLNDHFGFRDWLIYRYQREIKKRFDIIDPGVNVHKGIDDWYFFTGNEMLQDFFGQNPLSDNDLNEWVVSYREKQKWLKEKGIQYLLIALPSKQNVYPELVMKTPDKSRGMSRLKQFKNVLADTDDPTFIDLTSDLIKNKNQDALYFQSDTHWTPYGAYVAYLAIAEKIESMLPGIDFKKDFSFTREKTRKCESSTSECGDLTTRLLEYDSFEESYRDLDNSPRCAQSTPFDYQFSNLKKNPKAVSLSRKCADAKLKALVFRDSFFASLEPYFSENFSQVIYLWKYYDQKNVEELLKIFKPDIVIEEKLERFFFSDDTI